ncbi:hypothetical protein [Sphingobacterium sp. CZ-2]|uniref:hypothetical protein n=1 Tax=Sphingobacterium sp. CZ-2 TaxID=2557994 RepID=UPI00106FEA0B|nr:hypothetical protein [Sphingobacterium sp. CZ-2]QBR13178.1 hypothetical protein E3D81_13795 [Sphingobacterium sp. CZ-2]
MVSKNILVDISPIGTFTFFAYVFNDEEGRVGFGLFPNDGPSPVIYLLNVQNNRVKIFFNEKLIVQICEQSQFNTNERREIFRKFIEYASKMEKKAARLVFRDCKMSYLTESRDMVKYKRLYIHYKNPLSLTGDQFAANEPA